MTASTVKTQVQPYDKEERLRLFLGTFTSALLTAGAVAFIFTVLFTVLRLIDGQAQKSDSVIFWHLVFAGLFLLLLVPKFCYDFCYLPDEEDGIFGAPAFASIIALASVGLFFTALFFVK
jgi:hypothetical protein